MYLILWKNIKSMTVVNIYQRMSSYLKVTIIKQTYIKDTMEMEISWIEFMLDILYLSVQKKANKTIHLFSYRMKSCLLFLTIKFQQYE